MVRSGNLQRTPVHGRIVTIRAFCPDCGDVTLQGQTVGVRVNVDDGSGAYVFRCPECHGLVHKPCSRRVVDLLLSSGVRMQAWSWPKELSEPRPLGPPLTPDDLLDFHELLVSADTYDAWARAAGDAR